MKGQKILIGLGILIGSVYTLLLVLKISGTFFWYKNPTAANEPTIKEGKLIFASNQKEPSRGNFIVYKNRYSDSLEAGDIEKIKIKSYVNRLCALPGDIVEMKDGVLFVNGQNFDQPLILKAYYATSVDELNKSDYNFEALEDNNTNTDSTKTIRINLDTKEATTLKKQIKLERVIRRDTANVFQWLSPKPNYTSDNFGPIKVPANCYFVLGDNRHNASDSRFIGFIEKKDCTGVVINQ